MEILVDSRQRVSGDGLSIGGFHEDVSHGGLDRLDFWIFLGQLWDALATQNTFQKETCVFNRVAITSGAAGAWVAD